MCIHENIYENYDNYDKLSEVFEDVSSFVDHFETAISEHNYEWLTSNGTLLNKIKLLMLSFANPIYDEYYNDKIAYQDRDVFLNRMINTLSRKINHWYIRKQIEEDLIDNGTLNKFISNGGTHSETSENGTTGSAVIQKSASTPTGIQHNASEEDIDITLEKDEQHSNTRLIVDDNYDDKYTNFVGKTNGLHKNEVDRDTDITRTSNYGLALEILEKIPYSYINDVLKEVSQHFIQIY